MHDHNSAVAVSDPSLGSRFSLPRLGLTVNTDDNSGNSLATQLIQPQTSNEQKCNPNLKQNVSDSENIELQKPTNFDSNNNDDENYENGAILIRSAANDMDNIDHKQAIQIDQCSDSPSQEHIDRIDLETGHSETVTFGQCRYCLEQIDLAEMDCSMCLCNGALCTDCLLGELRLTHESREEMQCTVCATSYLIIRGRRPNPENEPRGCARLARYLRFLFTIDIQWLMDAGNHGRTDRRLSRLTWRRHLSCVITGIWIWLVLPPLLQCVLTPKHHKGYDNQESDGVRADYLYRLILSIVDLVLCCFFGQLVHMFHALRPGFAIIVGLGFIVRLILVILVFESRWPTEERDTVLFVTTLVESTGLLLWCVWLSYKGLKRQWSLFVSPKPSDFDPSQSMNKEQLLQWITSPVRAARPTPR